MFNFLKENMPEGSTERFSARRIAAFLLIFLSVPLYYLAFQHAEHGWVVYIPGGLCQIFAVVLFLFTTMTDIKTIVEAAAAIKKGI
jgi:hypothetical protein